jgi:hypothetical protein
VKVIPFDLLPDDVLLDIFNFYMDHNTTSSADKKVVETWQTLVHVCQRWRSLVFVSPRRLNLRLVCAHKTHTRDPDTLDIWPALPLIVQGGIARMPIISGTDNIIAVLEQSNRVCQVDLILVSWTAKAVLAMMQVPFPQLTCLKLSSLAGTPPVIPDSFLGGSAPRLRYFYLCGIPFPGLPKLLSSATHLVHLWLYNIPHSGYCDFSPEAMVASLSVGSSLESLHLEFEYSQSHPNWQTRRAPPSKRSVLPALENFTFKGIPEHLEDLVSRIDTPQLDHLRIEFPKQIDFDCSRLAQFINRTPKHRKHGNALVRFDDWGAGVLFGILQISTTCREPDRQVSSVAQVCSFSNPSTVEDLYIERQLPHLYWKNDGIENSLWLQLLLPFTAVKNLYLHMEFAPGIAAALQELVGDRITGVLPSLQSIFVDDLESSFEKSIEQFVVARRHSGHPVAISERTYPPT